MKRILWLLAAVAFAQDPVSITPYQLLVPNASSGLIQACSGCSIYTYAAGTNTPLATYTSSTLGTPNTNPVLTNSSGYAVNGSTITGIWVGSSCYKFVAKDANAVTLWTQDNICDRGAVLQALLAASSGASLIGFQPTGGSVPITVASALNSAYLYSTGYSTLALACSAAAAANKTLAVVSTFSNSPAQALNCDLWFPSGAGAMIQPASGATITMSTGRNVTAADFKIIDSSAGGTFTMLLSPSSASVAWWGAVGDDSTDNAAAITSALAASKDVRFPLGIYRSSTAQAITVTGQRISCGGGAYSPANSGTTVKFTGATSGFTVSGSGIYANSIENCHITATSATSVDGIRLTGTGTGVVNWALRNLHFTGTWEKAIHAVSSAENLKIIEPTCVDIEICLYIEGVSNSVDIISPLIGGTYTKGLVVDDSQGVRVIGGTIQGTATYLVENSGSPEGTILIGTWLEGAVTSLIESSSQLTLTDVIIGGGSYTDHGIHQSGVSTLMITGLTGVGNPGASKCLVQYDGNASGSAQGLSITGSYVEATGATRHAICVGTATTSSSVTVIEGNHLITSVGDNIVFDVFGGVHSIRGNYFTSSGYNINASAMADGKLIVNGNNFATNVESGVPADAYKGNCIGCTYEFALPGTNVNNTLMSFFPVNETTGALGTRAQIGSCTAARKGLSFPISDADTVVYNAVVAGGGANSLNIWCDGTNWRAH